MSSHMAFFGRILEALATVYDVVNGVLESWGDVVVLPLVVAGLMILACVPHTKSVKKMALALAGVATFLIVVNVIGLLTGAKPAVEDPQSPLLNPSASKTSFENRLYQGLYRARELMHDRDHQTALNQIAQVLAEAPQFTDALILRAEFARQLGHHPDALASLDDAFNSDSTNTSTAVAVLLKKGVILIAMEDYSSAVRELRTLAEIQP